MADMLDYEVAQRRRGEARVGRVKAGSGATVMMMSSHVPASLQLLGIAFDAAAFRIGGAVHAVDFCQR